MTELSDHDYHWYHSHFMALSVRKTGNDWESFVNQAMHAHHGGAFIQIDAAGRGDKGCDGYVDGLMMALYGASSPNDAYVTSKIESDLAKAKKHWGPVMTRWAFVHNNANGLPVMAGQTLARLRQEEIAAGDLSVEQWPPHTLWRECLRHLSKQDLSLLLGAPPSDRPAGMTYIAECLRSLARTRMMPSLGAVPEVPAGKVEHNKLSEATASLIAEYVQHTHHVRYYFLRASPGEQYQVAENLRMRYDGIRAGTADPDAVFHELVEELEREAFDHSRNPLEVGEQKSAALIVVTHFFETCIIFESPEVE